MDNHELYHYGIKGQRWGIRRFQKKNGSLTSAGKKRYAVADKETGKVAAIMPNKGWMKTHDDPNNVSYYKVTKKGSAASDKIPQNATRSQIKNAKKQTNQRLKENSRNWSDDAKEASKIKNKSVKEMSNTELKRLNERTRLEQEYSRLNPSNRKKAIAAVTATAATMGTLLNLYNNSDKLIDKGKPIVEKLINPIARKAKNAMAIGLWSDIHSDELYHYGVKGMKWGVRKTFQARKAVRKSIKSGDRKHYTQEVKRQNDILKKTRTDSEYFKAYSRGKEAIQKAMLRDAGFSEKQADAGAKWLKKHKWNITMGDTRDLGT